MAATNYSPSPKTLGATVTHPVDGDTVNNDNLFLEAAPGGTPKLTLAYLADCLAGATKAHTRSALAVFLEDVAGTPTFRVGSCAAGIGKYSTQQLDLPHGATLSKVTFYVDPVNASPPAGTKIVGRIIKRSLAGFSETQIGVDTTDPTTGASYGAAHSFDVSGAAEVIDRTAYTYYCSLVGETSTGAASTTGNGCTYTTT